MAFASSSSPTFSTRATTTIAVTTAENASIPALAESTPFRASDTPVSSETTTKMFSGTRNKEDSWTQPISKWS